jgi:hypothetical protein
MWLPLVYIPPLALRMPRVDDEADAVFVRPSRAAASARERTFIFGERYTGGTKNEGTTKLSMNYRAYVLPHIPRVKHGPASSPVAPSRKTRAKNEEKGAAELQFFGPR